MYQYVLAIHIIFVVCWMAGLFYMVRLFIYHTEAQDKPEPARTILSEQFEVMERKLWWIIATPSMYIVIIAGALMIHLHKWYMIWPGWLVIKLLFVVGLIVYHFICQKKMKLMAQSKFSWTSTQLRLWNELATILLFAIVFLVVLKSALNWIFGVVGIIAFSIILMMAVKIYKRIREKNLKEGDKISLKKKVSLIEKRIYDVVKPFCSENYSVIHYGVYDIDPKALVYWVCLKTDSAKQILENNPDLNSRLRAVLYENNYPKEGIDHVYIGFESQETVDRESGGDWWLHWK